LKNEGIRKERKGENLAMGGVGICSPGEVGQMGGLDLTETKMYSRKDHSFFPLSNVATYDVESLSSPVFFL
jgi:hypothetical protein